MSDALKPHLSQKTINLLHAFGLDGGFITTILGLIAKYGPVVEQVLQTVLSVVPPGTSLATILSAVETLLQTLLPAA